MITKKYEGWDKEPFAACENPEVPCAKWLLERITKPTNILDVGCGVGVHTKWFNDNGMLCHGITINTNEIEKRIHNNVSFGDMCQIPFEDNTFDLVFCLGSLEHTYAPFVALSEFNRVLKPNGHLFLDMPNIYNMEIMDKEYWYHKSVLFPIQVKDLLIKSKFKLLVEETTEKIEGVIYTASSQGMYIVQKIDDLIWK